MTDDGKLVTDDDWKRQAQREKEELSAAKRPDAAARVPDASIAGLLEEFSIRALMALGQVAHPMSGRAEIDLVAAKYAIDMLAVIEAKTAGNLTAEETAALKETVGNLKLAFVEISKQVAAIQPAAAIPDPSVSSGAARDVDAASGDASGDGPPGGGGRDAGGSGPSPKLIV